MSGRSAPISLQRASELFSIGAFVRVWDRLASVAGSVHLRTVMIAVDVALFFLLYLGSGFALLFGLWFVYDWRDKRRHEAQRFRVIFHCIKCGQIYTRGPGREEAACPECGFANGRLKF